MNKLKIYREQNKYSQKYISEYLRITQPNYSNIETGKTKLNFDYAYMLASLYNIPVSELISDKDSIYISKDKFEILKSAKNIIIEIEQKYK